VSSRIKWGVIGCGGIARRRTIPEGIVPASNAQLTAVFDIDAQANEQVAKEFSAQPCDSLEALLTRDIEAVYVASPAYLHHQQVLAAAKGDKHVLCEKPLGMTIKEAEEITVACKKQTVLLGTGFMMRFQTQHQEALRMLQNGRLGKPVYARAQLSCWYPPIEGAWRQNPQQGGGGSLMDMGGHCIDLLEMFFGKVKTLCCVINNTIHNYKSEDSAVVMLTFENGAMATVDTFFCIPDSSSKNVLELYGSKGSILASETIGQSEAGKMVAFLEGDDAGYDTQQARKATGGIEIAPRPENTYKSEIENFSQAIIDGCEPANSGVLGVQSQKILSACYESARKGQVVQI